MSDDRPPPRFAPGQRVAYRPDHRSFGEFIRSEGVRDATAEVSSDIASMAGEFAPRSDGPGPHMADEFHVNRDAGFLKVGKRGNIRVKVEIYNENPAAAPNEFGTKRNVRRRMLARAAAVFGDFKDHGDGS